MVGCYVDPRVYFSFLFFVLMLLLQDGGLNGDASNLINGAGGVLFLVLYALGLIFRHIFVKWGLSQASAMHIILLVLMT